MMWYNVLSCFPNRPMLRFTTYNECFVSVVYEYYLLFVVMHAFKRDLISILLLWRRYQPRSVFVRDLRWLPFFLSELLFFSFRPTPPPPQHLCRKNIRARSSCAFVARTRPATGTFSTRVVFSRPVDACSTSTRIRVFARASINPGVDV